MSKIIYVLCSAATLLVVLNWLGLITLDDPVIIKMQQESRANSEKYKNEMLVASRGSPSFEDLQKFYNTVKMEAYCRNLVSVGKPGVDGSKYACNPAAVKTDKCTLLSLGLNNQIGYDQNIIEATGKRCLILGADKDAQNPETQKSYESLGGQLFVGKIPDDLSVPSMLQKAGRKEVEILKMDIEGGEFTGLEPLIREYYVCQILIEIHGTPADHLRMLQIMAKYDYRLFNFDKNLLCPACCEYSLIHKRCMSQFGVVPLSDTIPTSK